jgi:hypothetical protein
MFSTSIWIELYGNVTYGSGVVGEWSLDGDDRDDEVVNSRLGLPLLLLEVVVVRGCRIAAAAAAAAVRAAPPAATRTAGAVLFSACSTNELVREASMAVRIDVRGTCSFSK